MSNKKNEQNVEVDTESIREDSSKLDDTDEDLTNEGNDSKVSGSHHERKKKKTFCKFCATEVTNFERHLERKHPNCEEVESMLSYPKGSKERKRIIGLIRNNGHFEEFLRGNTRPLYQGIKKSGGPYYPCFNCKGLYSGNFLHRHYKKCSANNLDDIAAEQECLTEPPTMLVSTMIDDTETMDKLTVETDVSETIKADEILMVAETDHLITQFGKKYLKKHNREQMDVVCLNKMRQLAQLLIVYRQISGDKNCELVDMMNPLVFNTVIDCVEKVGKQFESPNFSSEISILLEEVSELLLRSLLKIGPLIKCNHVEERIKSVERFKELISIHWTIIAGRNSNEKKLNKPTVLLLTKDVSTLRNYLYQCAEESRALLQVNSDDIEAYKILVNATLTLIVLYNRRHVSDVQYQRLDAYLANCLFSNHEQCLQFLSPSEECLTKNYTRIVIGDDASKAKTILFPQNLQDFMDSILEFRRNTNIIPTENPYLFALPGSERFAKADVAIKYFAENSHVEHPDYIMSKLLTKQIASMMQILNLYSEEIDQFARFMGHTDKTPNGYYKLSQDVYQTAKVAKLINLMDRGEGLEYRGKSLEEIDIDPAMALVEFDTENDNDNNDDGSHDVDMQNVNDSNLECEISMPPKSTRRKAHKPPDKRSKWGSKQIKIVKNYFKEHIKLKKAPKKEECVRLIEEHGSLYENINWVRMKAYVYNIYRDK